MRKKHEAGMTLLEVLIALFIFLLVLPLFPLVIHVVATSLSSDRLHEYEVELFYTQLAMEVREAKQVNVQNNIIRLQKWDDSLVTIEPYGTRIRRRVNQTGHDVLLQNVEMVSFEKTNNGVIVSVGSSKKSYERRLSQADVFE
ncbi:competence type IV pilus minor pilin ComGF [Alkalihalobacterium bogoriense]|uniref:competence type IV pilus minor pilin ComGF n=1 Tax=Alkalihalobacterium bogoriense TaxID=246272 RepID=UPI00047E5E56|nr:competence type IV pilus minor pilin ComGF [Alkalihalobacterium bogoriense]